MKENIVEASVIRKPNGVPLCVEILLTPDQLFIPPVMDRIDYDFDNREDKKTLIFRLQESEDNMSNGKQKPESGIIEKQRGFINKQ